MDEVKGRSFFFCILLHSNQFYSIPVPSCQVCWCEASLKSQRWEETTSSVKQCTWCETADDVWEALGQESESRDRLEQPSCAQQALASLESAAVWFCACVCVCVCVSVRRQMESKPVTTRTPPTSNPTSEPSIWSLHPIRRAHRTSTDQSRSRPFN